MKDDKIKPYNDLSSIIQNISKLAVNTQPILRLLDDTMKPMSVLTENIRYIATPLLPDIDFNHINTMLATISNVTVSLRDFTKVITPIISPFYDWLSTFDFSAILSYDPERAKRFKEENEFYMQSMYKARWFPYIGWHSDISLFNEILDILYSSKGISDRAVNRIDRVVMKYYTDKEIMRIKKSWKNSEIDSAEKKIMIQAINAYIRKEYAITSICLSTLWQDLIYKKIGDFVSGRKDNQTKKYYAKLIEENGYGEAFKSFFDDFIMYDCRSKEQALPDVPGRNSNAHGWHFCYPKKKAALNAIFLTDFILNLKETSNGVA